MNLEIFRFLNDLALQNQLFDILIIFIADWCIWWMFAIFLFVIIYKKPTWKPSFQVGFSTLSVWVIAKIFKYFYFSPRPFVELENVKILFTHGLNDSFPSGHMVLASALATAIYFYNKKLSILFFIFAILIGLSRIIVGIHWPLDIIVGLIWGVGGTIILMKAVFHRKLI
ncbi:MAG: phosphatase PAP2 family protein [Candidatus Pacebacteria bacterium]|nr:phosphatase PAP2 family protein [Candidatus Paceibacterota bacterium]